MHFLALYQKVAKQHEHTFSPKVVVALQKLDLNTHDGKDHDDKTLGIAKDARKALDYYYVELQKEVIKFPQGSKEEKDSHSLALAIRKIDAEVKKVQDNAKGKVADEADNPVILKSNFVGQYQNLIRQTKTEPDSELIQAFTKVDENKDPRKTTDLCKKAKGRIDAEIAAAKSQQAKAKDSKARGELAKLEAGLSSLRSALKDHDAKNFLFNKHLL